MYVIEWFGSEIEKYNSRETWLNQIAKLKSMGFHENWDFYCYEYR